MIYIFYFSISFMNKFVLLLFLPLLLSSVNYELVVPSNVEWYDSNISVNENNFISILSEGEWQYDPRPNFKTGAQGLVKGRKDLGSLLMKCNKQIILVEDKWEGNVNENCTLMFGMYDDIGHSNNKGFLNVNVNVTYEENNGEDDLIEDEIIDSEQKENVTSNETDSSIDEGFLPSEICSVFVFFILLSIGVLCVYKRK